MQITSNPLDGYLRQRGERGRSFSARSGLSEQVVSRIRNGRAVPTLEQAVLIERATAGEIAAARWVDLPVEREDAA